MLQLQLNFPKCKVIKAHNCTMLYTRYAAIKLNNASRTPCFDASCPPGVSLVKNPCFKCSNSAIVSSKLYRVVFRSFFDEEQDLSF